TQVMGELVRAHVELAVRELLALERQRGRAGSSICLLLEEGVQRLSGHSAASAAAGAACSCEGAPGLELQRRTAAKMSTAPRMSAGGSGSARTSWPRRSAPMGVTYV